jgi:hypothetical protein
MSIHDQRNRAMWPAFASHPNFVPYEAMHPAVIPFGDPGYPVNP